MARRERERYTERTKPHRIEPGRGGHAGGGGGGSAPEQSPLRNPVVLVAVGALVLAGALAVGVMMGRRPANQTAAGGTPTAVTEATAVGEATAPTDATVPASPTDAPATSAKPSYSEPVDQKLDPNKTYFATIETPKGNIELQLWPDVAPKHVNSFAFLARAGFFDGLKFHRVVPGFVIQGGDPLGTGMGDPGYSIPGEFNADNPVPHRVGTLAMARSSDPNSAGSQFYVVLEDGPQATNLDGEYTVFGHVTKGMNVVKQIAVDDLMTKVTIEEKDASASVVSPDDVRAGKLPEND